MKTEIIPFLIPHQVSMRNIFLVDGSHTNEAQFLLI